MKFPRKGQISPENVLNTARKTTKNVIRTVLHLCLPCTFRMNDINLRYLRLPHSLFGDAMFSRGKSRRGNTCAEVFGSSLRRAQSFIMKNKSQAHDSIS